MAVSATALREPRWKRYKPDMVRRRANDRARMARILSDPEQLARYRAAKNEPALRRTGDANKAARKAGAIGHLTVADVRSLFARQPSCVGCGVGQGLDHVVPLSQGGSNLPDNIQNLCHSCNASKGSARHLRTDLPRTAAGRALLNRLETVIGRAALLTSIRLIEAEAGSDRTAHRPEPPQKQ